MFVPPAALLARDAVRGVAGRPIFLRSRDRSRDPLLRSNIARIVGGDGHSAVTKLGSQPAADRTHALREPRNTASIAPQHRPTGQCRLPSPQPGTHGQGRQSNMAVRLDRRTFLAGGAAAATLPMPAIAQNKPIRIGLLTVKTGPLAQGGIQMEQGVDAVPQGPQQHARRPQGRADGRRHRRQPRRHQDQGAGTDRARQRRHDLRPAGRVRAAGDLRLRRRAQDADPEPGRGRGHVAAQAQPVFRARLRHLGAEHAPAGRLRGEGAEVQERHHHQRGLRLRLRADGRLPARVRGRRRPRGEEAVAADRHARLHAVSRAAQRRRCGGAGLRRLQSAEVHEAVQGCRASRCRCSAAARRATMRC